MRKLSFVHIGILFCVVFAYIASSATVTVQTTIVPTPIASATSQPSQISEAITLTPPMIPTQTEIAPTATAPADLQVQLQKLVDGLDKPLWVTASPDGTYLIALEQVGRVRVIERGVLRALPMLDIAVRIKSTGNEQGLLGLAFSPRFLQDALIYVNYTDLNGNTVVSRFRVDLQTKIADADSEEKIIQIAQPFSNHNGGMVAFAPDGMLWIGMGDGGSQGDPNNNAQNPKVLLGKILRLDVSRRDGTRAYAIPQDNPLINGARNEVWAMGLRNPWRFSFDRATGDVYIADVGQNIYEEINYQPTSSAGGENYGWRVREAFSTYKDERSNFTFTDPIHSYTHAEGGCSVTGGYVYRGELISQLVGDYVYGDFCSGKIWALRRDASGKWQNRLLLQTQFQIASFGEDENGELLVIDRGGAIYRIQLL